MTVAGLPETPIDYPIDPSRLPPPGQTEASPHEDVPPDPGSAAAQRIYAVPPPPFWPRVFPGL